MNFVSWFDAARFGNWLGNGQPAGGGTETGAYDVSLSQPARQAGATWALPNMDEWYRAALYTTDDGDGNPGYWFYATQSDMAPTQAACGATGGVTNAGANVANYFDGCDWNGLDGKLSSVAARGHRRSMGTMLPFAVSGRRRDLDG